MTKNAPDILKSLHEFIVPEEDVSSFSTEQVHAYLKCEGIDPSPLVNQVKQRIQKLKAEMELTEARAKRADYLKNLNSTTASGESFAGLKEKIRDLIQNISTGNPGLAAVYFKKFEVSSEEDLSSLFEDLSLLDDMENENVEKQSK